MQPPTFPIKLKPGDVPTEINFVLDPEFSNLINSIKSEIRGGDNIREENSQNVLIFRTTLNSRSQLQPKLKSSSSTLRGQECTNCLTMVVKRLCIGRIVNQPVRVNSARVDLTIWRIVKGALLGAEPIS